MVIYLGGDSKYFIGNRAQIARGDGKTDTGEDVRVVALTRKEGLPLPACLDAHFTEGRSTRKHTFALEGGVNSSDSPILLISTFRCSPSLCPNRINFSEMPTKRPRLRLFMVALRVAGNAGVPGSIPDR